MTEKLKDTAEFQLGLLFQEHGVGGDMKFKQALLDWCERQVAYGVNEDHVAYLNGLVRPRFSSNGHSNGHSNGYHRNGFTPEREDD